MTNNAPFDDQVKKQLGDYQPDVPAHIWENIMANKEKRKPAGFFFNLRNKRLIMIGMLLLLSAGTGLLVHHYSSQPDKKPSSIESIIADNKSSHKTDNAVIKNETEGKIAESNHSAEKLKDPAVNRNLPANQPSTNNIPDKENSTTNKSPRSTTNQPYVSQTIGQPGRHGISNRMKSTAPVTGKNILLHQDAEWNTSGNVSNKIKEKNSVEDVDHPGTGLASSAKNRGKVKKSLAKTRMEINSPAADNETVSTELSTDAEIQPTSSQDIFLSKYYLSLAAFPAEKAFSFSVKKINMAALNIPCPELEKNVAGNKRYVEIYGGPDYVFRSFNDTANSSYLQKRKESTRFSSAFSAGVRYTRVFNNAMSFRTGLNFSQVNEKFSYVQGQIVQLAYILNEQGDTTGSFATTGTRYKTTHNRYRTLDIPLIIGYEMGNGKFHTNINAGLVVNLYSWQKGDLLDTDGKPIDITTGTASSPYQFKTNVGVGFMGGASFYYKITGRLHILAEPYFRYNLSAANKAAITLKQKYTTTGLRVGLRMDF